MEIKINEQESYTIDIPSSITAEEFLGFFERLNNVKKIVSSNLNVNVLEENSYVPIQKQRRSRSKKSLCPTREAAIELFKLHYFGTSEEKENFAKSTGRSNWSVIRGNLSSIKSRWNIVPKDIGIRKWVHGRPTKQYLNSIKIKK